MLTAIVAEGVKQYASAGEFRAIAGGKAVEVATAFMNEIGQQAGNFTDASGRTVQYFKAFGKDYTDKTIYANEYNTVELQDFAWRTQGLNLKGSNPTIDAINNYVVRADDQRKVMYVGLALMTGGVAAELTPVLLAAVNTCRWKFAFCKHQAAMVATEMVAQETLFLTGGGTLAVGTSAGKLATTLAKTPAASSIKRLHKLKMH